jgi:bacterioferritin
MYNFNKMQGSVMSRLTTNTQPASQNQENTSQTNTNFVAKPTVFDGKNPSQVQPSVVKDKIDSVVLGYLGRALSFEWSFGQNCLTQASLASSRGEIDYAQQFIDFSNAEFQHANILVNRIVSAGMIPASSVLQPTTAANNIVESLQNCWNFKNTQINLYFEASKYCLTHSFVSDNKLFNTLLQEEQEQLMKIQSLLNNFKA